MAKVFLTSFLVAAFIAATHGIPVPTAVDWTAVGAKVHEIQVSVLNDNFDRMNIIARNDNPDVNIPFEVNYIARHIRESIRQMEFQITSQTLTTDSAGQKLNNVRRELETLTEILSRPEFLPKLSENAVEEIEDILKIIYASLSEKQAELNDILTAPKGVNWDAVSAKVQEIQVSVINDNFDRINTVARNDNPDVNIAYEVNYIARHIRESIRQMEFQVTSRTLTNDLIGHFLSNVRRELSTLTDILSKPEFLPQLSEKAAQEIQFHFSTIYSALGEKQGELYAILSSA